MKELFVYQECLKAQIQSVRYKNCGFGGLQLDWVRAILGSILNAGRKKNQLVNHKLDKM